jgi:hypothetical protein
VGRLGEAIFSIDFLGDKHGIDAAFFEGPQDLHTEQVVGTPLQEHEQSRRGARVDDDITFVGERNTNQIRENPAVRRQGYRLRQWIERLEIADR